MIALNPSSLKKTTFPEYAIRFVFGGACTLGAGLVAKRFGPSIGGLFLAFPAIFPAGACLIATHEKREKAKLGFDGKRRGRAAASVDAAGAAVGCVGLVVFAFVVWIGLPRYNAFGVIVIAMLAWTASSIFLWAIRRNRLFHHGKMSRSNDDRSPMENSR